MCLLRSFTTGWSAAFKGGIPLQSVDWLSSDWEVTGALHHQTWINLSYINLCSEKRSFKVYQNERDSENDRGKKLRSVQNPHENLVP